ncbi:MAG TPA: transporter [Flavobacterium sp.]
MLTSHRLALLLFILFAFNASAQFTDVINSNRPGESMSAFSVGKTVIQAELGLYRTDQEHEDLGYESVGYGGDLAVRYGAFFEQLELILEANYMRDRFTSFGEKTNRNGFQHLIIGGKFLIYDPNKNYEKKPNLYSWKANHSFSWREFIPAVGVYAGVNLNLFDSPYHFEDEASLSPKLMLITQNQFGKWVFVTNIIADKVATNFMGFGYVATVTRGFNPRWSGFLESQGFKDDFYTDVIFRVGAAFLIKENIQVDASIGKNVKDTPSILTGGLGLSWRFDDNYEEVYLRVPKDEKDSDKDAKGKKDKKKNKKKRRDEVDVEAVPE